MNHSYFRFYLLFLNLSGQRMQLFDVVSHADEVPFAFYCLEAPQQEASEPHDRFDDAKNRFRSDFPLGINFLAGWRL